jgi:hypothetical protein
MDIIEKTKHLRDEAWQAVITTPAYKAYKSLDDAVNAMAGSQSQVVITAPSKPRFRTRRITNGDVAERVLRRSGEPLPIGRWLEAALQDGASVKGDDPLANFRSTVSRDQRFYSLMRNNMYFWWLKSVDLPEGFMPEPEETSDLLGSGSSASEKGGDGHAPATT